MLKREITFDNFDGETVTETHYFFLSKIELLEMNLKGNVSFEDRMVKIMNASDYESLFKEIKELVLISYGERPVDSTVFMKTPEVRNRFEHSLAFDALMGELIEDADQAAAFVVGILPEKMQGPVMEEMAKQ